MCHHRTILEARKKKKALFLAALVFFGLIVFFACTKPETAWKGTAFTEDGVTVVMNPEEPIYDGPVLELQEDLTISGRRRTL